MDLEDLTAVLNLFDRNVEKAQQNLIAYKHDVDTVRQSLMESWSHVARADGRIISVHDGLLSSVSEVNEYIIKLNLHINMNRAVKNLKNVNPKNHKSLELNDNNNNGKENHTNLDGIEVGELDVQPATSKEPPAYTMDVPQIMDIQPESVNEEPKSENSVRSAVKVAVPVLPIPPRQSDLLPPKGGREMTSNETYDQLYKNMIHFSNDSIVDVVVMHINLLENYFFVAKWGEDSKPLKELMKCEMPVEELHQLPDFGETFAIYDDQEQIIPRILIYAYSDGGGYDAYLLDYGEPIHLNGDAVIFRIPEDVAALPAEAVRCYVRNQKVDYMRQFLYKHVRLRILGNNGYDLEVELLEDAKIDSESKQVEEQSCEASAPKEVNADKLVNSPKKLSEPNVSMPKEQEQPPKIDQELVKSTSKLSPEDMAMLEDVGQSTSDAVKAVLGFNPTDDQRICRHYDPKYGGCFKGSNCRLLHQPFAPHGATKDTELAEALPEIRFESFATRKLGSSVRVLFTYITSPTKVYVQFVGDESPPLVWSKNDVPESERIFKRDPLPLDMVLALYNDGYYYRAQIIEKNDGMFKIFYVDYGNTEFVTIRSLAQCNNARSLKPHRAVCCFFQGVKRIPLSSRSEAIECVEYLKSELLNVEFNVTLVSRMPDDGYVIKFVDHHADILRQMMKDGYVDPITDNWEGDGEDIC